jgi:polysaccharide export outer membrane protein
MLHLLDLGLTCGRKGQRRVIDSQLVNNGHKYWKFLASSSALRRVRIAAALFACTLAPVLLVAQSGEVAPEAAAALLPPMPVGAAVAPGTETFRIGIGDILGISVWKEPDHSVDSLVVRPDGKISLPLLREVDAVGLTPLQLEDVLTERFTEYINNPTVTVVVREIRSQIIYLTGAVVRPGSLLMRAGLTAWQALSEGGGVAEYAKRKKIYIVREVGGVRTTIDFDYNAVMDGEAEKDLILKSGDTIVVPE